MFLQLFLYLVNQHGFGYRLPNSSQTHVIEGVKIMSNVALFFNDKPAISGGFMPFLAGFGQLFVSLKVCPQAFKVLLGFAFGKALSFFISPSSFGVFALGLFRYSPRYSEFLPAPFGVGFFISGAC